MAPTPIPPENKSLSFANRPGFTIMLLSFFLIATFLIGIGVGTVFGRWSVSSTNSGWASIGTNGLRPDGESGSARVALTPEIDVFWEAMGLLYKDFYGDIPDSEEITTGAINGALNQLDDQNTSYMPPEQAEFFSSRIEGSFEGIGARVEWSDEFNAVQIVEPFENQPAWNAGVRRDDYVIKVDGEDLTDSNLTDAIMLIRGEKGSTVTLTIVREGVFDPFDIEVERDKIDVPSVENRAVGENEDIAYVRLNTFSQNASGQVAQALEDEMAKNPKALIFDLRGNSGGLLTEAVRVSSLFIEENSSVLIERFADGSEKTYKTEGKAIAKDIPLVVLINGGSASASEIVAGAIQDANRAPLIGETSFGKGSVQIPHRLSNDGIMRVTIARWYTPADRTIDKEGLTPDIEVVRTEEDFKAELDPQLEKAIEYLNDQLNK